MLSCGLGSAILEYLNDTNNNLGITRIGIKDTYVMQGTLELLKKEYKIDLDELYKYIEG